MLAEQDEKMYRDAKKKDALQRVQFEIDQQAQKGKAIREHKERMKIKREQLAQVQAQEQENQK